MKSKQSVGARHCEIREVDKATEIQFLNNNHFQGYVKSDTALGLYYNNELVEIMTFGKARYSKKYQKELIRLCSSMAVVGGAKKLFNYYVKNFQPESIVSYCDLSKFTGEVYAQLGFKRLAEQFQDIGTILNYKTM